MKKLVVDEWLWADLKGENQLERQRETFAFLLQVFKRCDQLVTVVGSKFMEKFWRLAKDASTVELRKIVKVFKDHFFLNSNKLQQYQEYQLRPFPEEMRGRVKEDDQYLVRVYLTANADVLITTDNPLIATLNAHDILSRARDEFLREYLSQQD